MVAIIQGFPEFDELRPFTGRLADILYGIDNIKKALGAVGWAAKHTKMVGNQTRSAVPEGGETPRF